VNEAKTPHLIVRLWNGDVPMATIFWLFIVVPNFIFKAIQFGFDTEYYARGPTEGYIAGALIYVVAVTLYMLFMLLALWHSAGKNPEAGFWCYLARAYVGLNGAFLLWQVASLFNI
jgi:hypothetical protein